MLRNARQLEACELRARDGKIGHVSDFYFDDRAWTIRYLVIDAGTWLENRQVLIAPAAVRAPEWEKHLLPVELTREQVRHSPPVDTAQPVSRDVEAQLARYYNWPAYWGSPVFPEMGFGLPLAPLPFPPPAPRQPERQAGTAAVHEDPHLRSVSAVSTYDLEAADGGLGHVEDFLIDDASWQVRYLVIDTRNWWPGKRVLIAPQWIDEIGWDDARVHVHLSRATIKAGPAYDPARPATPDYTRVLHDHYGLPPPPA
jgi:hypothetical protein